MYIYNIRIVKNECRYITSPKYFEIKHECLHVTSSVDLMKTHSDFSDTILYHDKVVCIEFPNLRIY